VHCHQGADGQGIDVGIDGRVVTVPPREEFAPNWLENGTGLSAQYFSDTNLSNSAFTRADTNINFNWSFSAPGGGLSNHVFSARWTGSVQPRYTEGYTFHFTAADGCRLWIDNQLLIDRWQDNTNGDRAGSIALTGGRPYEVRAEYYDYFNPTAGAVLEWNSASQSREIVPQRVLFPANTPPILAPVANATITAGQTLTVTNSAADPDLPAQTLTWSLTAQPAGASINATNGVMVWRPTQAQASSTNLFTVVATDNGTPPLAARQDFYVAVSEPAKPIFSLPTMAAGTFQTWIGGDSGPDYAIYAATNLAGVWQLLQMTNPASLPFLFLDTTITNFQRRYYRVQLGP